MTGTADGNIRAENGLEVPESPLGHTTVFENIRSQLLRDFKFLTDKQLLASQLDIVMVDKVVTDV